MALSAHESLAANSRVERCVDRLLQHARTQDAPDKAIARRNVRRSYCARFEKEGWVYEDGALRIRPFDPKDFASALVGEA